MRDRGRFSASDFSRFFTAVICAGQRPVSTSAGIPLMRARKLDGASPADGMAYFTHSASVSGWWNANTSRERGWGGKPVVKRVSTPVDWEGEGRGLLQNRRAGAR